VEKNISNLIQMSNELSVFTSCILVIISNDICLKLFNNTEQSFEFTFGAQVISNKLLLFKTNN